MVVVPVAEGDLIVVVFEHARGHLVNFADWKWISDQLFAFSWGRWMGLLHR